MARKRVDDLNAPLKNLSLSTSLEDNFALFEELFQRDGIMRRRRFENFRDPRAKFAIFFSDGVTDSLLIGDHIVTPLVTASHIQSGPKLFHTVKETFLFAADLKESEKVDELVEAVTYGDTVLFVSGSSKALIISSKSFVLRSPTEPENERVLTGPREGFSEGIMQNLSLLRRRLRTNDLKMEFQSYGRSTKTAVCICYLDRIVNKKILAELMRRLNHLDVDGILDSNYLTEYITEKSHFGFTTTGSTERPDVAAAKLLEGRVIVVVDGSPAVLTLPYLFIENFQSGEDYYLSPIYGTFFRMLRIIGFFLSITVPSIYIALVTYHHEVLPAALLISFTAERSSVPLPAAVECFVMLFVFDILRETGIRMPAQVGQAMSIVGALVIGQAAVEASLVAAPMVIVVAFTGITSMLVPRTSATVIICRYLNLVLTANLGMLGLVTGISLLLIHLLGLESYGVPYLTPLARLGIQEVKDTFVRAPWPDMVSRIAPLSYNRTRAKGGKKE